MRGTVLTVFVSASLVLGGCGGDSRKDDKPVSTACACGTATPATPGATCTCAELKAKKSGWCDHCGMGMVDGKATTCSVCARSGKMCDGCAANDGKPCTDCKNKGG